MKLAYDFSSTFSAILIALLCLNFQCALAISRLHRRPIGAGRLKGFLFDNDPTHFEDGLPRRIEISAKLKKDLLIWDELGLDGVKIKSCWRNVKTGKAFIYLRGSALDRADLEVGSSFAINADDWKASCGRIRDFPGAVRGDNVLFFIIEKIVETKDGAKVGMKMCSGRDVVPNVRIRIQNAKSSDPSDKPRIIQFLDDPLTDRMAVKKAQDAKNTSLPAVSRASVSFDETVTIFSGVTLTVESSLDASISSFDFVRLSGLEVRWEQELSAEASVTLDVTSAFDQSLEGELFRAPIPNLGFEASIPLVGSVGFGAFVSVDWVAELAVDASLSASYTASYALRQRVTAAIADAEIKSVENLPTSSNTASAGFEFTEDAEVTVGFEGFAGVRPGLSVEASVGDDSVGVGISAKVGLQAESEVMFPGTFPATTVSNTLGDCSVCHHLEGSVAFVGKDFAFESDILVSDLFEFVLGTLCALEDECA